jgi:uncharacterized protein (TIGR00255 family)
MIKSMTGGGNARRIIDSFDVSVRVRSVNSRFLDLGLRLPQIFYEFESVLRQRGAEVLARGKVDIFVDVKDQRSNSYTGKVNIGLVNSILEAVEHLRAREDIDMRIDLSALLNIQGVLSLETGELDDSEALVQQLWGVISAALADLEKMKRREGEKLYRDIRGRAETCREIVGRIETSAGRVKSEYMEKLSKRLQEFMEGVEIDRQRLEQEVAFLADRSDITEEIVRIRSHLDQLLGLLDSEAAVGKKLDFIVQEIFREINTIGSKSRNLDLSKAVIDFKSELERIREQVQNVE